MKDRELLEMAAKAAGYTVRYVSDDKGGGSFYMEPSQLWWGPLTDDGDALRLAVKLRLELGFEGDNVVFADGNFSEFLSEDPASATRRAIVRAAAEIGRAMP